MDNKKSQSSVEFSIIMGFAILLFVVFMLSIQASMGSKAYEKNNLILKNIALSVQDEVNLALESSDGYHRNFNIPEKLNGREYEINITQEMVYVRTTDLSYAIALPVPNATGDVKKGANTIRKEEGIIRINV